MPAPVCIAAEESIRLASAITGARFHYLDKGGVLGDPEQGVPLIKAFIEEAVAPEKVTQSAVVSRGKVLPGANLSLREIDVLRLIAAGLSNQQIAAQLMLSVHTVRRHVSNILDKTGSANRTEETSVYHENRHS